MANFVVEEEASYIIKILSFVLLRFPRMKFLLEERWGKEIGFCSILFNTHTAPCVAGWRGKGVNIMEGKAMEWTVN